MAADIVYEDEAVVAFLDIRPMSKGHTLVIPKLHSKDLLDTDDEVLSNFLSKVKKIAKAVAKAVTSDGLAIRNANGSAAGQTVFHLHFHIIPRFINDGLSGWTQHESEPSARAELAELIKKQL